MKTNRASRPLLLPLAALVLVLSAGGFPPPASAHEALMPAGARHGLLIGAPWVLHHAVPFDEGVLERELRLPAGQLAAYTYDDHHTLAQLARTQHVPFERLVARLTSWASSFPADRRRTIAERTRIVLVSGHLAQHVLFHPMHSTNVANIALRASGLDAMHFSHLRHEQWSLNRIITDVGGDLEGITAKIRSRLTTRSAYDVAHESTPPAQGARMLDRQLTMLPCWMSRPGQPFDPQAPYDRQYLRHGPHTAADMPRTEGQQRVEERAIERARAGRAVTCWNVPDRWTGRAGVPLGRQALRDLARLPHGWHGRSYDSDKHMEDM